MPNNFDNKNIHQHINSDGDFMNEKGSRIKFGSDGLPKEISSSDPETYKASTKNPYSRWIYLARALDAWRPFPRAFIILYMYMVYRVIEWYIALEAPSMEQSALISVVVGAGAAWFGLYVGSGKGPSE